MWAPGKAWLSARRWEIASAEPSETEDGIQEITLWTGAIRIEITLTFFRNPMYYYNAALCVAGWYLVHMMLHSMWRSDICTHTDLWPAARKTRGKYPRCHGNRDYRIQYEFSRNNRAPHPSKEANIDNMEGADRGGIDLSWDRHSGEPLN